MITSFFKPKKRKATPVQKGSPSVRTEPSSSPESVASSVNDNTSTTNSTTTTTSISTSNDNADNNDNKRSKRQDNAVQELLQFLKDDSTAESRSWRQALDKHFSSKQFETLAKFVVRQRCVGKAPIGEYC